jgi:hypothetical protein
MSDSGNTRVQHNGLEICISEYVQTACAETHLLISDVNIDVETIT